MRKLLARTLQRTLRLDRFRHVARVQDDEVPFVRRESLANGLQCAPHPGLVPRPVPDRADGARRPEHVSEAGLHDRPIVGMHELEVVPADELAAGVAELLLDRRTLEDGDAVLAQQRDVVGGILEEGLVEALDPVLPALLCLLLRDVEGDADQPPPSLRRAPDAHDIPEPDHPAIGRDHPVLELVIES
jgi:hypothetical protein